MIIEPFQNTLEKYSVVSPQNNDSMGNKDWNEYLVVDILKKAWEVPEGSPYANFQKFSIIYSMLQRYEGIKPRFSIAEKHCQDVIQNVINDGSTNAHTALVLDSGGAHSIAMAVQLAKNGYQPIIMF